MSVVPILPLFFNLLFSSPILLPWLIASLQQWLFHGPFFLFLSLSWLFLGFFAASSVRPRLFPCSNKLFPTVFIEQLIDWYDMFIWKKTLWPLFYGWGSTASRLKPSWGGSLLFTTKFPEIPGTHLINLGRMECRVELRAIQWFWTRDPWIGNLDH